MPRPLRWLLSLALLICASTAWAQTPFQGPGQSIVVGQGYELPSKIMGDVRRINVMLPPDYGDPQNASARYPVLYLLDGGAGEQDFVHIASMVEQGSLWAGATGR